MEKSKTTPDAYPLTINSLTTGCNQKTNRQPLTNLSVDQIERVVEELRAMGALGIIQGSGRVEKIRHYAYEWLALSKVEAAVMAELLLRGEQTLGDLRARAARMEPIADQAALQPIVDSLIEKNLVVSLTPPGRGQIVTHNLHPEWELEAIKKQYVGGAVTLADVPGSGGSAAAGGPSAVEELRIEIEELKARLARLEAAVFE